MIPMDNGLTGLLGLARKAGKAELGEESVTAAAHGHKARLILVASDAAENTRRRALTLGQAGNAPVLSPPLTKGELGRAVGRASCALLALTDVGLASSAAKKLAQLRPEEAGDVPALLERKAEKALRRKRAQRSREKAAQAKARKPWAAPPPKKEGGKS